MVILNIQKVIAKDPKIPKTDPNEIEALKSQTARIDHREAGSIALQAGEAKNPANLLRAQDDWKLLFESVLEEKLDFAQGNGDAAGGVILDIFDMQEILSKLFLRDQI